MIDIFLSYHRMQIYYLDMETLHQKSLQLEEEKCPHCQQTRQQVSHGFVYKKRNQGDPYPIGKRIFCSNRRQRTGCGRTTQLYVASVIRYLKYAGAVLIHFVLAMTKGYSIQAAYQQATGTDNPRHAYRWINRIIHQLSFYRSLFHQPSLKDSASGVSQVNSRRSLISSTFKALILRLGEPVCSHYQQKLNLNFLPSFPICRSSS
jgi:hypothetical protein